MLTNAKLNGLSENVMCDDITLENTHGNVYIKYESPRVSVFLYE